MSGSIYSGLHFLHVSILLYIPWYVFLYASLPRVRREEGHATAGGVFRVPFCGAHFVVGRDNDSADAFHRQPVARTCSGGHYTPSGLCILPTQRTTCGKPTGQCLDIFDDDVFNANINTEAFFANPNHRSSHTLTIHSRDYCRA